VFFVYFYVVETSVLYNVRETFIKTKINFSRRKVVFLLSLFQTFAEKKKNRNCVLFFPVVLFGIASQSSQNSFFAEIQEYFTRH